MPLLKAEKMYQSDKKNACQGYEREIRILEHKIKWLEKEIIDLKEPK